MGLLSCTRPEAGPSPKQLVVELERKRDQLQEEVTRALQKVSSHEQEAAAFVKEREGWTQQRLDYESSLQANKAQLLQLLERCSKLNDAVKGSKQVSVSVTAYDPEKTQEEDAQEEDAVEHAAHSAREVVEPEASPEAQLEQALAQLGNTNDSLMQRVEELTAQLAESKAAAKALEDRARVQQAVAEQRCCAMESENSALAGLSTELQSQLDRLQQEQAQLLSSSQATAAKLQAEAAARAEDSDAARSELEALRARLAALEQDAADKERQQAELLSRQEMAAVEAVALSASLSSRDTELQALAAARAAEAAGRAEAQAALGATRRQLSDAQVQAAAAASEVTQLRRSLEASQQEFLALSEAQAQGAAELSEAQQQLSLARRQLSDSEGRLLAAQERGKQAEASAAALEAVLVTTRAALAEAQQQVLQRSNELSTMLRALNEAQERCAQCEQGLAAARAASEASEHSLQGMTAQYVAAKRDLIATSKQMAAVALEHNSSLDKLHECSQQLSSSQQEVQVLEARVLALVQDSASSMQRLHELERHCPQVEAELMELRTLHRHAVQDMERIKALLKAISLMSAKGGGQGQGQDLDTATLLSYYEAAVREDCLRLKVSDTPLALCGSLCTAVADSRQLSVLTLDLDSSREQVWEKAGLRIACLAAALGANSSLRTLELSGWTWSELGNGCALPFLTLGSSSTPGGLSTVKIDTKLFDVECASALLELLQRGLVELKRPGGQGVLRLYSDNEDLDEWYGTMIQDALDPACFRQAQHDALRPTSSFPSAAASLSSTPTAHLLRSASASAAPSTTAYPSSAASPRSCMPLFGAGAAPHTPGAGAFLAGLSSTAATPGKGSPGSVVISDVPDSLTDLSNKALESHHMVVVLAVLVCCPHLKRLRLDGNKVGNAGAELLALGLTHNWSLRELLLSRNNITVAGAKKLARALACNTALRRLDLSAQRFEGLGPLGAEAVLSAISAHNGALEELSISSNSLGASGAALVCAALRGAGPRCALKRLGAGLNGFDSASARALQEAAAERGMVVTV